MGNFEHACEMLNNNVKILFIKRTKDSVINENADYEVDIINSNRAVVNTCVGNASKKVIEFKESIERYGSITDQTVSGHRNF